MQANLNRLTDLTAELRRQLKPLGRQAEVARRAAGIQADLRDARLRLLADDLATLRDDPGQGDRRRDRAAGPPRGGRGRGRADQRAARRAGGRARRRRAACSPQAQDTWYQLSALQERFRSLHQLAAERHRNLSAAPDDERPGRDPDQLTAEAEKVREQEDELRAALEASQERLADAVDAARRTWSAGSRSREKAIVAAHKAIADRREGLAKLTGQVESRPQPRDGRRRGDRAAVRGARRGRRSAPSAAQAELDAAASAGATGPTTPTPTWRCATRRRAAALDAANAEVKQHSDAERAAEKDARPVEGPRGGPRDRAAPQGRRRHAARPRRPHPGPARQRRGAAVGAGRARGGAGRRARRARRRRRGRQRRRRRRRGGDAQAATTPAGRRC